MIPHFYQDIQGWFDFEELYSEMVRVASPNARFVEIGAWKGKSTAFMAVEIANSRKNIEFIVIDTWEGSEQEPECRKEAASKDLMAEFMDGMIKGGVSHLIRPIKLPSIEASRIFEAKSFDFIFVDGAHDYDNVRQDIIAWTPKLKPGGFMAGHDYDPGYEPGVVQAVDELVPDRILGWGCCWLSGPHDKVSKGVYAPWSETKK